MTGRAPHEEPRFGSWRLTRSFAVALYGALALAAAAELVGRARPDLVPALARAATPFVFGAFLALFGVYRFALVRAGRYPAAKAFVQVGAGALFLMLLLPFGARDAAQGASTLAELLDSPDPVVRALACEVARGRPEGRLAVRALARLLEDPAPEVRAQALLSLTALAGEDVGGEDPGAAERWRAWAERQGSAAPR